MCHLQRDLCTVFRRNAKIELLRGIPLFSGCSRRRLAEISMIADEIDLPAGRTLIREGERGRQFIVVAQGSVDVSRKGRKLPIRGESEFFGEIALLRGSRALATVTTATPVRALVITDRGFRNLIKDVPSVQRKILQSLLEQWTADAP